MTKTLQTAPENAPVKPGHAAEIQHTVLIVDGERKAARTATEVCTRLGATLGASCELLTARTLAEAREIMARQAVSLLVADVNLPDGQGLTLIPALKKNNPEAAVIAMGKVAGVDDIIDALRNGAEDFVPKPFTAGQLRDRLSQALTRQSAAEIAARKNRRKVERLREAVRKLGTARRTVAKKVDLLCNDLVAAYGEISRQVDSVRVGEDFRKLTEKAADLEQLLCHTMDWLMRRCGYSNIAVFLATGESFQLGAYVKYTMASSPELTEALLNGLVAKAGREGFVRVSADEANHELTAAELRHLRGHSAIAANCTYLGDSLATLVLFRDGASPFTAEDAETFRIIAPLVAVALASHTREPGSTEDGLLESQDPQPTDGAADGTADGDTDAPKPDKVDAADWWKRGEAPPF